MILIGYCSDALQMWSDIIVWTLFQSTFPNICKISSGECLMFFCYFQLCFAYERGVQLKGSEESVTTTRQRTFAASMLPLTSRSMKTVFFKRETRFSFPV